MSTIEELLEDPQDGGFAVVSGEYAEDEAQLAANPEFRKMCLEIPAGYELGPEIDRHALTMMINRECHSRGITFSFIGSPRKAMRKVRKEARV